MRKIVIIGLGPFGQRMLEEFCTSDVDVLIIDTNKDRINENKSKASSAYITNIVNLEALRKVIPDNVDAAIIGCEEGFETSLLVTHLLKKIKVQNIIVKADSETQEEILYLAGATHVVIPDREAAHVFSQRIFSEGEIPRMEIAPGFLLMEIPVPKKVIGTKASELVHILKADLMCIAVKKEGKGNFDILGTEYVFTAGDLLLMAGKEDALARAFGTKKIRKEGLVSLFNRFFHS